MILSIVKLEKLEKGHYEIILRYVAYRNQCSIVAKQLNDTKEKYFSDKVDECAGDTKMLHKIADKLLVNQHIQLLPTDDDDNLLANAFSTISQTKSTISDKISHFLLISSKTHHPT